MFKKKHDVNCAYCKFGYILTNESDCICDKYGLIERKDKCSKFIYEPLKRIPSPPATIEEYSEKYRPGYCDSAIYQAGERSRGYGPVCPGYWLQDPDPAPYGFEEDKGRISSRSSTV